MTSNADKGYNNLKEELNDRDFELLTPRSEYKNTESIIKFKCVNTCINISKANNIRNKIRKGDQLCIECNQWCIEQCSLSSQLKTKLKSLNHKFISYDKKTRLLSYICNCGKSNISNGSNVMKETWKSCTGCSNQLRGNINTIEDVRFYFEEQNCKLLSDEYINNHSELKYICQCSTLATTTWKDFTHGKRCEEVCKVQKYKETCLEKYGVENVMHDIDIFMKQQRKLYSKKSYTFPSGKIFNIMGYENLCINELLKEYKEEDIEVRTGYIPIIKYVNINGNNSVYYPDIYIKNFDILIEVKSDYTFKDKENTLLKMKAASKLYNVQLWIFSDRDVDGKRLSKGKERLVDKQIFDKIK